MEEKLQKYEDVVTLLKRGYSAKKAADIALAPYSVAKELKEYLQNNKFKSWHFYCFMLYL